MSGIFEAVPECPEDLSLSTLAQRSHKELFPRKPAGQEEKGETPKQSRAEGQSVGREIPENGVKTEQ